MARIPAPTPDDANRPLADTGSDGLARLHELEQLLATACQVRRLAETELREGRNLERAGQRRDAAARMQRKVERELLRLRSELAGEHPEVNQVWTPGDPVGRKPRPAPAAETDTPAAAAPGDFELAVMLGTRRPRWQASTSDFSIENDSPGRTPARTPDTAQRQASARPARSAPRRRTARRESQSRSGSRGRLLTLVLISALAGAGLSYLLSQTQLSPGTVISGWQQAITNLLR